MRRGLLLMVVVALAVLSMGMGGGVDTEDGDVMDPLGPELRSWLDGHGPLRVGWSDFIGPTSLHEDGVVTGGYGVDLWDLAALKLGIDVEHVVVGNPAEVVEALRAGEVDVAGAFARRPDLLEFAEGTEPFAWVETGFVAGTGRFDAVRQDLAGATVTTISGSPHTVTLEEQFPELRYVETGGLLPGLQQVADGEIDLYLGPFGLLGFALRGTDVELRPIGPTVAVEPVGPYTLPGTQQAEVARLARASLTDAELALTNVRWTGFDLANPDQPAALPAWLVPVALGLVGALVAALLFVLLLRSRVRAATTELREVNEGLEQTVAARTVELARTASSLERSNQALQRFTSTAAHDLKGPLGAISGLVDLAVAMDLPAEQRDDLLARVRTSAVRLGRMIDDMLDDAVRLGAGRARVTGTAFAAWVREVTAPEVDAVGADLQVTAPEVEVDTDVETLRRTALNLVGNATKYAVNEDGVRIHVMLRRVDGAWELVVDDNGPGVPEEQREAVFERGTRLTHDDRGFGLGLSAIRDLVHGAGGTVGVEDAPLGGARFVVELPAEEEAAPVVPVGDTGDGRGAVTT